MLMTLPRLSILIVAMLFSTSVLASTTVSFYSWRRQDISVWEKINEQNLLPGIQVEVRVLNRDSYLSFLMIELQNGNADVFLWKPGASNLSTLIEHDFIAPYTDDLSNINASALLAAKAADGQFYGVPFAIQLQSIMVNKKLVEKHGVSSAPQTLGELSTVFTTLKNAGITPLHLAGGTNWYISQVLSEVLVAGLVDESFAKGLKAGNECFTNPKYFKIFEMLQSWKEAGYLNADVAIGDYTVMSKTIALGNSAMSIDGGWMASPTSDFYVIDPEYQFDFWAVPGESGKIYALGDGTFQVGKTSRNVQAANRVLSFTTTKKFAEMFALHVNELPAYGKPFYIKPGELKKMANMVASKTYGASLFTAYALNKGSPSYNTLIINAIQAILKGEKTPEQAAMLIQDGLNSWGYDGASVCEIEAAF